jgi:putative DNA primase/helicase
MSDDPFARIAASASKATTTKAAKGTVVTPVPADAPPAPAKHPTLGKLTAIWRYNDADGRLLGYACRFDSTNGKQFRPLTLWRPAAGAVPKWRWESWPEKRPLYGLAGLAERPRASVLVVEGEKAADAAAKLLPGFVVVTSPNGSKSARKADWSRLRARRVFIWPDADAPGIQYALAVAELVKDAATELVSASKGHFRGAVVKIIQPPADAAPGWDAADALHEGWTTERAAKLVETAVPPEEIIIPETGAARRDKPQDGDGVRSGRRRTPQRDVLVGLTKFVELWHDANRTAYASFHVAGHRENWPVRSRDFLM